MTDTFRPETVEQVRETVAWAVAQETPLEIVGAGGKRALGRPMQTAHTLSLAALRGIGLYEPEELICQAGPGTPLAEIETALEAETQRLAFEPMDLGGLLGDAAGVQTIGGVFACNLAGPRRIKDGAARDHLLGFSAVTGRGDIVKSGGRVVKNVTGYDLSKLVCGSWGTLAAVTDLTFKVLPAPETESTVIARGLDDAAAVRAMSVAIGSAHDVSSAGHLPAGTRAGGITGPATAIRVEGFAPSVAARCAALRAELAAGIGEIDTVDLDESRALWRAMRDARPIAEPRDRTVWKLSTAPMAAPGVTASIARAIPDAAWFYDWAGGLIWLSVPAGRDGQAGVVRAAIEAAGGHATLIRAAADLRAAVAVFHPQPAPLAALTRRIKESFDPGGVLNPGRMTAGA